MSDEHVNTCLMFTGTTENNMPVSPIISNKGSHDVTQRHQCKASKFMTKTHHENKKSKKAVILRGDVAIDRMRKSYI